MRRFACRVLSALLLTLSPVIGQDIVIDWETRTLTSWPSTVNEPRAARVIVNNVNDYLYEYEIGVLAIPRKTNDAGEIVGAAAAGAMKAMGAQLERSPCEEAALFIGTALGDVRRRVEGNHALSPKMVDKKYPSIKLSDTDRAWKAERQELTKMETQQEFGNSVVELRQPACAAEQATVFDALNKYYAWKQSFEQAEQSSHRVTTAIQLYPETDYQVTIEEYFPPRTPTVNSPVKFDVKIGSDILMLSLGTLFTSLEQRTYEKRKIPGAADEVLVANGTGRVMPQGVALLNYRVPRASWLNDNMGLALSSGPVIRFGGAKSETSSLGFFAGVSFHLWNRLFLTPGLHIGEFADYPAGFGNLTPIPASFGEISPVKRWVRKFAFGISYRTNSLVGTPAKATATAEGKPAEAQ